MRNEPRASWQSLRPRGDDGHAPSGGCCSPCHGILFCFCVIRVAALKSLRTRTSVTGQPLTGSGESRALQAWGWSSASACARKSIVRRWEMSSLIFSFLHSQTNVPLPCVSFVICWIQAPIVGRKHNYVLHKWFECKGLGGSQVAVSPPAGDVSPLDALLVRAVNQAPLRAAGMKALSNLNFISHLL